MAFRIKTKNRLLVDDRQTLDAKHNNILQSFEDNKLQLPELHEQLNEIHGRINKYREESEKKLIVDLKLQNEIWKLDDQRVELEKLIYNIEHNVDETQYMIKTGKLLSEYYKILDKEKQFAAGGENVVSKPIKQSGPVNPGKKKSIMDWFDNPDTPEKSDSNFSKTDNLANYDHQMLGSKIASQNLAKIEMKPESKSESKTKTKNSNKSNIKENTKGTISNNTLGNITLDNILDKAEEIEVARKNEKNEYLNKDSIYEKYMKMIDKNYITINPDDNEVFDTCSKCLVEMLLNNNTGSLMCPKCGILENIIVDSDKPSFKEPPKEMTSFCYKRINHLNEFLAQFQAKETTDIPEDVYNEILMEIKKERITNMALITPEKMRELLKRIRKNDYYEHIPYIINQLNGLPAPVIAPEIEEIIRGMFKAIQIPFEKYCPPKRKNFLSYSYIMYKFFELLELDEYLQCFQLLKSRTKLHQQDQIWKNICSELNWQFIKSV